MNNAAKFVVAIYLTIAALIVLACGPKTARSEEPADGPQPEATPRTSEPITLAAVGDMMIGSPYPNDSRMPPNDGADMFKSVAPILTAADITFGNLEGPMTDGGVSAKCRAGSTKCFAFRMPTRYNRHFKDAGFDVMSLANNHAGDFGDKGRSDTRAALDAVGIKHAGSDQGEFSTTVLNVKGLRVAFIGFGHNNGMPSINDLDGARRLVTEAAKKADLIVVSFHGGAEGTNAQHVPSRNEIFLGENRGNLPLFARTVIDAGADLVLGHGPHVMRGMELYRDRLIAYSMGNFATYGWFQLAGETALTMVLEVKLAPEGEFLGGKLNSATLEGRGTPTLDPSAQSLKVVRTLSESDFGANAPKIADDGTITAK